MNGMAAVGDYATVRRRIESAYPGLSPQLRNAARYVLQRPDEVALYSMRELAGRARVHPTTMVRLAKALNYPGYLDFREPFRQHLREGGPSYVARARNLQVRGQDASLDGLVQETLDVEFDNLQRSFAEIGSARLIAAAKALTSARSVYVVGLRSCYPAAFLFDYAWRMFENKTVLLDGHAGSFANVLQGLEAEDAMLAISLAPYTRETVQAVAYARTKGAALVSISDSSVSPIARNADVELTVATDSPSFFQSIVSAVAIVQALIAVLVAQGGEDALAALEETEHQLHSFDAYWKQNGERGRA